MNARIGLTGGAFGPVRPFLLSVLVSGFLMPPLALAGCALGLTLLAAGLLGRGVLMAGRCVVASRAPGGAW